MINEALCSENCVARWLWKQGQVDTNGSLNYIKWDMQSVNTCPENFQWQKGTAAVIQVDAPGLYELTMAFFSRKKRPLI